jgi:hypothetical protein
VKALFG